MKNYFINKIHFCIVLSCIIFSYSCEKMQNTCVGLSSKTQKLVYKSWMLHGATKDGKLISSSQFCSFNTFSEDYDVDFTKSGTIRLKCKLLFPDFSEPQGVWELNNKKDIEITITDSSYQSVYVPVSPVKLKWEIITLTRNSMRVKESRKDGEYEFSFTNNF